MSELKPIRPASTLVLSRGGERGLELYLLRRSRRSSFMANVMVYPGGGLEQEDHEIAGSPLVLGARSLWADDEMRALAVAGLREAYEEAGVLCAIFERAPSPSELRASRQALLDGRARFGEILRELRARLVLDELWYFSRWVTPNWETKRYDARFFFAEAPSGQEASSDERETEAGAWYTPQDALDAYERGELILSPPTWATLTDLRGLGSVEEARAFARSAVPSPILPHLTELESGRVVLLPGDPAYPAALDPQVDTTLRHEPSRTRIDVIEGRFREALRRG